MNIERLVGYTHRTPTQFVKGAVVAPRNLVMVETTVIGPRRTIAPYAWILFRFGLQDPAEQTHGAAQLVISICVGRATGYAAARPFALGGLEGYVGFHRCAQLLGLPRFNYARTRPWACTSASQSACASASTSLESRTVWATCSRRSCVCRRRRRWISVFSVGSPTFNACAAAS